MNFYGKYVFDALSRCIPSFFLLSFVRLILNRTHHNSRSRKLHFRQEPANQVVAFSLFNRHVPTMALLWSDIIDSGSKPAVAPFGHAMRASHFPCFDNVYIPLNHGSFGAFPSSVRDRQRELQDQTESRVDYMVRYAFPPLLDQARVAIAPLLGVATDEVVFVPNVTTAVNTVLRSLRYGKGDVILCFSTGYQTCEKTIDYLCESTLAESICVEIQYPIEDEELVRKFREMVDKVSGDGAGRKVKIALFDTVVAFPGVKMPWETLVKACREVGVLSLIDGAHGIGHIDLTSMGEVGPDFFTSNCYK